MKQWLIKIAYIVPAIIIIAVSVNMFLAPHDIAAGGITGLAVIFERMFSFERSSVILIGNLALLIITFFFLERPVFFNTIIGALLLPVFIGVIPGRMLINDPMLSMITGSVLFGIAVSILYHNKASSGGTSIPPLIFKKYLNLNTSVGLFITDGAVVLLCLLVFSADSFLYAIFSIFITSATMKYIESGLNKKKMVYIISEMNEKISKAILSQIEKGVTIVPVIGAYTHNKMDMLMVTLEQRKYQQLLAVVNKYDEKAFVVTDTVSDVHGRGFTYESGTV